MIRIILLTVFPLCMYAAAPVNQPTAFVKSNLNAWKFSFSFNAASGGAQGYLVMINTQNNFVNPVNGMIYKTGSPLSTSKIVSNSAALSHTIKGCWANTKYYIKVYAFNNTGSPEYNLNNPLFDSVTTTGKVIGNYYNGVTPASPDFLSKLSNLLLNHTMRTYDDFEKIMVPEMYERDTIVNDTAKKVVECEYSNEIKTYLAPFDFANNNINYSREHVLCKNWMNKRGIPNGDLIYYAEGCDYHNLLLTRTSNVNSSRSDNPYGKVNNITSSFLDCKYGKDASNTYVFEPANETKGNGARCMFYQMMCYNGFNGGWGLTNLNAKAPQQDQAILKNWHLTDPVDNFEIARNELIFSLQNNRNPFIDFPEWADCIDFSTINQLKCSAFIHHHDIVPYDYFLFQDPQQVILEFQHDLAETISFQLFNMEGKMLEHHAFATHVGKNKWILNVEAVTAGVYFIKIAGDSYQTMVPIKFIR